MNHLSFREEVTGPAETYVRALHALSGLYLWEWLGNLQADRRYIKGPERLQWPMVFYFLDRYCLLLGVIWSLVVVNIVGQVDCQVWYTANQILFLIPLALAHIIFSLRVKAAWSHKLYIVAPLSVVVLGYTLLLLSGYSPGTIQWNPSLRACVYSSPPNLRLLSIGLYLTASLDFVLTLLLVWSYLHLSSSPARPSRTELFFITTTFAVNLPAAVIQALGLLSPTTSSTLLIPMALISTISACRTINCWKGASNDTDDSDSSTDGDSRHIAPSQAFMQRHFNKSPGLPELRYSKQHKNFRRLSSLPSLSSEQPTSPSSIEVPTSLAPVTLSTSRTSSYVPSTQTGYTAGNGGSMIYGDVYDHEAKV